MLTWYTIGTVVVYYIVLFPGSPEATAAYAFMCSMQQKAGEGGAWKCG